MRYAKVRNAAVLLGLGLAGFGESLVLGRTDPWAHALAWLAALAGVFALWRAVRGPGRLPSARTLVGYLLVGLGAFSLADGLIAHRLLELHAFGEALYDWLYVIAGGALVLIGLAVRDGQDRAPAPLGERRVAERRRAPPRGLMLRE
jgi:uncharacterized membrane protein